VPSEGRELPLLPPAIPFLVEEPSDDLELAEYDEDDGRGEFMIVAALDG
jgi:hypothetical protein